MDGCCSDANRLGGHDLARITDAHEESASVLAQSLVESGDIAEQSGDASITRSIEQRRVHHEQRGDTGVFRSGRRPGRIVVES